MKIDFDFRTLYINGSLKICKYNLFHIWNNIMFTIYNKYSDHVKIFNRKKNAKKDKILQKRKQMVC